MAKKKTSTVGDVVVWSPRMTKSGEEHAHIGFYVGKNIAINHNDTGKVPMEHPANYRPVDYFLHCPAFLK